MLLAAMYRKLSWQVVEGAAIETVKITAMVFAILIGATAFSMVFVYSGADYLVEDVLTNLPGQKWTFILLSMLAIMLLGFFIDFIEISYIVVPILLPIVDIIGLNPLWFAILIAMNLQTSFLTPPFGFSLFYLKGVCPAEVRTTDLYGGVIPFILIQVLVLFFWCCFPAFMALIEAAGSTSSPAVRPCRRFARSFISTEDRQAMLQQISVLIFYLRELNRLRQDVPEAWDDIDERYVND